MEKNDFMATYYDWAADVSPDASMTVTRNKGTKLWDRLKGQLQHQTSQDVIAPKVQPKTAQDVMKLNNELVEKWVPKELNGESNDDKTKPRGPEIRNNLSGNGLDPARSNGLSGARHDETTQRPEERDIAEDSQGIQDSAISPVRANADVRHNGGPDKKGGEDLNATQVSFMRHLCDMTDLNMDVSPKMIVERMGIPSGSVGYQMDELERKEYLYRKKESARKVYLIPLKRQDGTPYIKAEKKDGITKLYPGHAETEIDLDKLGNHVDSSI